MRRKVEVTVYDSDWEFKFQSEAELIKTIFKKEIRAIHHIGSTSIPGRRSLI